MGVLDYVFTIREASNVLGLTERQIRKLLAVGAVVPARDSSGRGSSLLLDVPALAVLRAHKILSDAPAERRPTFTARVITTREHWTRLRGATIEGLPALVLCFSDLDTPGEVLTAAEASRRHRERPFACGLPWVSVMRGLRESASHYREQHDQVWMGTRRVDSSTAASVVARADWRS